MSRIPPDLNDNIVWLLNETSGPYKNTGSLLTNDSSTDLLVTNTVVRNQFGLFDNGLWIPGSGNFPEGALSTRNYVAGAKNVTFTNPFTISFWVLLRAYFTTNTTTIFGKEFRDSDITSSWSNPLYSISIDTLTTNSGQDWSVSIATSPSTRATFTITDYPIPLGLWSHIGVTWDGTSLRVYLNGNKCIYYSGLTQMDTVAAASISYTDGVNGMGYWKIGAITATGSPTKQEPHILMQDIRIANVVRDLEYFQNIYKVGVLPINLSNANNYYKLRVYDLGCEETTPVVWVDTEVSITNAPVSPCGGPYSDIEVLDRWIA